MTLNDFLSTNSKRLTEVGIITARLDCLVLLEDVLNTNRTQILAHAERELTDVEFQKLTAMIDKRAHHIPLAYIRRKTEFYGREFAITNQVLEPRPESETMIDMLKTIPPESRQIIIDVGTGSGALAVTAKLELPDSKVVATDIDANCLSVAKRNAAKLSADIICYLGDLLAPVPAAVRQNPATLLCNLPYVPDNFHINTAATHEPRLAIFGGPDGLDLYRRLFAQLEQSFSSEVSVLCESLPPQHEELVQIAQTAGFQFIAEQDFIQLFRRS